MVKNDILVDDQNANDTEQSVRSNLDDKLEVKSESFNATNRSGQFSQAYNNQSNSGNSNARTSNHDYLTQRIEDEVHS